jgi:lantibiotic biosynthesis protein
MSAKLQWSAANYYLLRLPVLPIGTLDRLTSDPLNALPDLWANGPLAEAVFVASAGLHAQIVQHIATKGWPLPTPLLRPLLKYALRMSSRPTPFGLMAGCALGHTADATQVVLRPTAERLQPHRRLDMDCLARLVRHLVADPLIRPQLRFFTNNSLYEVGDEVRYVDCDTMGEERHYFMSGVLNSTYLQTILGQAQTGATIEEMIQATVKAGIDSETASHFVNQLIDQQLVVSELEPALTGPPMLAVLAGRLGQLGGSQPAVEALRHVEQMLASIQPAPQLQAQVVAALQPYLPTPGSHVIQTDLFVNTATNQLGRRVVDTILEQLNDLQPLNYATPSPTLREFASRFRKRYEQREVPLSEALDGDVGVGYGDTANGQTAYTPLVSGLSIPQAEAATSLTWGRYEDLVLSKFGEGLQKRGQPVALTTAELTSLKPETQESLPASFYVFGNLMGASEAALDRGEFQFNLLTATGPSAATLLGRFCAHSPQLTRHVQASLQHEEAQNPSSIYAEIAHWPNSRVGNVLVRPALRQYEIPYNSPASVAADNQLPISDLMVSVRANGRVMLRSKRLDREVIPRLSNAHNYKHGLSTYRFLADLAYQSGKMNITWSWGPLKNQPYLPRITYKNLILSRAMWSLPVESLPTTSAEALAHYLRHEQQVPRWVAISQGDNELVIDLEAGATQQLLLEEAKRHTTLTLVEWLATPDQCWLHDGPNRFNQELILPCESRPTPALRAAAPPQATQRSGEGRPLPERPQTETTTPPPVRSFAPGSEWLFVKLYTGVYSADKLLTEVMEPFCHHLMADGLIDRHFYIRYYDPDFHLRIRFHSTVPGFVATVLTLLNQQLAPYQQTGSVYKVQVDTYERELERYGEATMALSETVFCADSSAMLHYLCHEEEVSSRWQFALQSCDTLLADFGLTTAAKVELLQTLQARFLAEHNADQTLRKQLNDRYRAEQGLIGAVIDTPADCLRVRSETLRPVIAPIRAACLGTYLQPNLPTLLASYLHMSLNRLFTSKHRMQEMVIYHFLTRFYESQLARQTARQTAEAV